MGREYYRNEQIKICGQSCLLETWHETRGWFESNMRHSRVTHYNSGAIFEETSDDSYHVSDPAAKRAARAWISNWLTQQEAKRRREEEERRRKEQERQRIEAVRRAEQERYDRQLRQQQQEHERQLRQSQIISLNALKNEKSAERQRIITYELSCVEAEIPDLCDQILTEEKEFPTVCLILHSGVI